VANNSDRDAFLNDLEQSRSGSRAQIAGFRIVGASKDEASVELAFNAVNGEGRSGVVSATFPMRWEQGDWKFVATAGDDPYSIQPLDSTSGFIPWGGA
jgi:hypothetical protein